MKKAIIIVIIILVGALSIFIWRDQFTRSPNNKNIKHTASTSRSRQISSVFDKNQFSINDPTSLWVVVDKLRPLNPIDYTPPDLVSVGNGQVMRSVAAKSLDDMETSAQKQGISFYAFSGYRSYQTQVSAYNSEVSAFGVTKADQESARPGYSEHQTGWAVDLGTSGCEIGSCFASTPAGKWLASNAYQYGFLLRYPQGLQDITGYEYEPWHFRYIGTELSEELHKDNIKTLEQFFGLPPAPNYK